MVEKKTWTEYVLHGSVLYSHSTHGRNGLVFSLSRCAEEPCCLYGLVQELETRHGKTVFCWPRNIYIWPNCTLLRINSCVLLTRKTGKVILNRKGHPTTHILTMMVPSVRREPEERLHVWREPGQGGATSFSSLFFPQRCSRTCSVQSLSQHAAEGTRRGQHSQTKFSDSTGTLLARAKEHSSAECLAITEASAYLSQEANCVS